LTSIVGVYCSDGVVIGTDSSATFSSGGLRTIEQETKKIEIYHGTVIVAGTGEVGLGQRFCNLTEKSFRDAGFTKRKPVETMADLSQRAVKDFQSTYTFFPHLPSGFNYGALVAYSIGDNYSLCEFDPIHFRPELKLPEQKFFFSTMGSGQVITDPFLALMRKIFWNPDPPTVAEAKFIITWALTHAIEVNTGGINGPIQMAAIRKNDKGRYSAAMISDAEIREHSDMVESAESHLADFKRILIGGLDKATIPEAKPDK
jgi:20S proteasome alpha/beta subunit